MGLVEKLGPSDRWEWWARLCRRYLRRYGPEYADHAELCRITRVVLRRRCIPTVTWNAVRRVMCEPDCFLVFVRGSLYQVPHELKPKIDSLVVDNRVTQLYRHFDKNGVLLYVGISLNSISRLAQHRSDSGWFLRIARIDIENYPNLGAALHAERTAIKKESPLYNRSRIEPGSGDPIAAIEKLCKRHAFNIDGRDRWRAADPL